MIGHWNHSLSSIRSISATQNDGRLYMTNSPSVVVRSSAEFG